MIYQGIYSDDILVVFKGKKNVQDVKYWLEAFQHIVYKAEGNQLLQFIAVIWTNDTNLPLYENKYRVQMCASNGFLFLYINMI